MDEWIERNNDFEEDEGFREEVEYFNGMIGKFDIGIEEIVGRMLSFGGSSYRRIERRVCVEDYFFGVELQ